MTNASRRAIKKHGRNLPVRKSLRLRKAKAASADEREQRDEGRRPLG